MKARKEGMKYSKDQEQEEQKKGNTTVESTEGGGKVRSRLQSWTKPWVLSMEVQPGKVETSVKLQV